MWAFGKEIVSERYGSIVSLILVDSVKNVTYIEFKSDWTPTYVSSLLKIYDTILVKSL